MKSRFSSQSMPVFLFKTGLFLLSFLISSSLFAQQDSILITGFTSPTCGCDGFIDITATGVNGPSQPPTQYLYLWSNGSTSQDLFGVCPGTYCVTVSSNSTNNPATQCFFVQQLPPVTLDIVSSNTAPCNSDSLMGGGLCEKVCPGTTVTYSVTTQFPNGAFIPISWSVSGASSWTVTNVVGSSTSSVTVVWGSAGAGNVFAFADGASGCSSEASVCVTVIDAPNAAFESSPAAAAGAPLQVCLGQTVSFQNQSTGGADYYEWLFSDDLSISSAVNPQHTYLIPGTHTVRLIASSNCLCSDTTLMTIEVLNAQAPTLECVATVCPGETVTYTASNACAPFSWSVSGEGVILNGGTPLSDSISVQWNGGPVGTITLGAQPCSGAACPVAGVIEIPIITNNAEIVGEEQVCPGSTEVYTIEPFGGTGFVWSLPTGGTIVAGQGTNRVTVDWGTFPNPAPAADHTLYVQYTNCYLGCGGEDFIHVRILPSFSISGPLEACVNSNANFAAKLTGNNAAILCNWTVTAPDGSTAWTSPAAVSTPSIPFLNGPGIYQLLAVPADATLTCSSDAVWAVNVRALPSDPTGIDGETNICPGTAYTYEALGIPTGGNVRWTVKNGTGATQTLNGNPVNVTWGNNGPYWLTAAQISSDGLGCLSDTVGLVATPITAPTLAGTPVVCEDNKGTYTMPALQNVNIQWTISPPTAGSVADGQGTNTVDIFWSEPGGHVVTVAVCSQIAQFPVTVLANPDPVPQHPAGLCPGATALVQTVSPYATYTWKDENGGLLSNAATPTLIAGIYSIEVVDANGCKGASEFEIASWDEPAVSLTTADPTGFCNNSYTVSLTALTNTDANYTYEWFKDGALIGGASGSTHFSNQYGLYTVEATNSYGCTGTAGPIVIFEDCSGGSTGGVCTVCSGGPLCAAGTLQCVPDPTARCDSFTVILNDYSGLYVPGTAQWTTGISGGVILGTATGDNPSFVYPNAGKFIVAVRVQLSDGTICNALDSVKVEAVARFDELPGCPGFSTDFENRSEILPNVTISNYAWDFDDLASGANNTSSVEDPMHSFGLAGIYDVTLTVTAASGCTSSLTKAIEIPDSDPPVFTDPATRCAGNALEFIASPNADIIELNWDFGDPASGASNDATGNTVYHSFPSAGTYTVIATSNNVYGCTATFTRSITVQPPALSGNISPANPGAICEGSTITLTAPAGAVSYLWSDDNQSTTQSITTGTEGTYKVTMTDANGCTYSPPTVKVEVNAAPDALIKALIYNELGQVVGNSYPTVTICEGEDLALQGFSNGLASYSWSGGNGSNQVVYFTDDRNTLLPAGSQMYTITVTSSSTGCTAVSAPFLVTVNPTPNGLFINSPSLCAGDPNVITYFGPTPSNWQFFWNTGQTGTSLTTEEPGAYYVRVINEFGCEGKSNIVNILPGPPVNSIPAGCHTRCSPDTLCIPNLPNIASWQWYLDGNPIPGATSANFIAQQSGTYWAQLTDVFGCTGESDPLSLNLFTGYGNIIGQVWSDVNNNGLIDAADTLLSGITVVVYQNGSLYDAATSGANGEFALTNILSTNYTFAVDPFSLPSDWSIVIGNDQTNLSGCDVVGDADFLLHYGCLSIQNLQLQACPGGFATYNGTNISVGGTQSFQMTTASGCDSTVVVSVVALTPSASTLSLSTCPGTTASYNGTNLAVGATQNFTFTNWQGCDSVVTVSVSALPTSASTLSLSACPGTTASYNGTNLAVGATQNFTFANWQGCDSVVTVTVSALPTSASTLSLSACPGTTASYNGTNLAVGATQNFTFANWQGCDSVVTVTVSALPTSASTLSLSACPGTTASYNGTNLAVGATQNFTFANWQGCDSVVTVTVSALPTSASSVTLHACPGGSVTYNGSNLAAGSTTNLTLSNAVGCDSVVTVSVLGDLQPSSSALNVGVCPGETYTYQGSILAAGAVQNFTFNNAVGCDSVVTVTVFQKNVSSNLLEVSVCPGETYLYQGEALAPGDSKEFHFLNAEVCDSTVTVFVSAFPETNFGLNTDPSCSNLSTGILEITGLSGGPAPYAYSLDNVGFQDSVRFVGLSAGNYTVFVQDGNGCIFEQEAALENLPPLDFQLANGILPCENPTVTLAPEILSGASPSLNFNWWDGSQDSNKVVTEAGNVWLEITDQCGTLRKEASVKWADLAEDLDIVYIPNVFKPSSDDAQNIEFKPFFAAGIELLGFHFEVFDRWGNKLFETSSTADGWGGIFRNQNFNPGVQVWHLEADVAICGRVLHVERKGDVTVVR